MKQAWKVGKLRFHLKDYPGALHDFTCLGVGELTKTAKQKTRFFWGLSEKLYDVSVLCWSSVIKPHVAVVKKY